MLHSSESSENFYKFVFERRFLLELCSKVSTFYPVHKFFSVEKERGGPILKKNLWRRRCVRRTIFRMVEVRVDGVNPYFVCNTAAGSLYDLSEVILHQNWI